MTALAESAGRPVRRLRAASHDKLRHQARLQIESVGLDRPKYEVLAPTPVDPHRGLALLPPPSPADVAFDIEGFPLADGGLEYLLGAVHRDGEELTFSDWWAHDDREEKLLLRELRGLGARPVAAARGDLLVYHYASYEVTAMRRLMGKHGTREREVDDLLRNEVFVDLYTVVHQGLRVGVPSYSLKQIEHLYLESRQAGVATAGESIVFYQRWLEEQDGRTLADVEDPARDPRLQRRGLPLHVDAHRTGCAPSSGTAASRSFRAPATRKRRRRRSRLPRRWRTGSWT